MSIFLHVLLWFMVAIFFLGGLAGSVIPSVPGPPIVFVGALLYSLLTGFSKVGWLTLLVLGGIAALAQIMDSLAAVYGVKKLGGSAWGMWGSIIGGIVGLFVGGIPGMLVGLFAGAFLLEWWKGNKEVCASLRVGGGSLLGFLGGTLMKVILSLFMIGIFLVDVLR